MIRGVNLGEWLVLEYWMGHDIFDGVQSEHLDETSFSEKLGEKKFERLKYHRDNFIKLADFEWLKSVGVDSVRIPVPHWIFDDCSPYVGCVEYLDKAFDWAKQTGVSVLIDLHTAPGCQNGFDNGGITGVLDWYKSESNIERTVMVLDKLAARYKDEKALYGIELLNEPSWDNPPEIVRDFYLRGYAACRKHIDCDKSIVIHDQFNFKAWKDFMRGAEYKNVILDTHCYHCFSDEQRAMHPVDNVIQVLNKRLADIKEMSEYFPVIVGEWSLGLSEEATISHMSPQERNLVYRTFADAQLLIQEQCHGWYFWSYKLYEEDNHAWSYRKAVENRWIPKWL